MSEPPPAEPGSHRHIVETLLADAAAAHATLLAGLPEDLARVLPVDAQGIQAAIDHLARAADLDAEEQRALIRPHAVNPAVLHARVFGAQRLTDATVHAAFSEGVRVRALALGALADRIGGEALGVSVRRLLNEHPPPSAEMADHDATLRAAHAAQERAAVVIAAAADLLR